MYYHTFKSTEIHSSVHPHIYRLRTAGNAFSSHQDEDYASPVGLEFGEERSDALRDEPSNELPNQSYFF